MNNYWMVALVALSSPAWAQQASSSGAHRFDMVQNGKAMTAEDFDAWMGQRGVKVLGARHATHQQARPMTVALNEAQATPRPAQVTAPITGVVHSSTIAPPPSAPVKHNLPQGTIVPFGNP